MPITNTPTAPLPTPAVDALHRLDVALAAPDVHRAAVRYGIVTARIAELEAMDASHMSAGQFDALLDAQNELAMRRKQLTDAGRLDLVEVTA